MQSSSQNVTINKPTPGFLQAGCPSCRPTNSVRALKGKDIILSSDYNVTPTTRVFEAASSVAVALLADTAAAAAAVV